MSHQSSAHYHDISVGMGLMILAMFLLPAGDSFAKILTGILNPAEVTMWRMLAQGLCLVPVALIWRNRLWGPMFSPVVALSGLLITITLLCLISAFAVMPIATAIAIFFVEPLLLTLLAGPFLGEVAGPRRLAAVGVGLIGALIVIRPSFADFGYAAILPLVAATGYALNMIVLRHACATRSGLTVQCGASAYSALVLIILIPWWRGGDSVVQATMAIPVWGWGAIICAGALAATSFVLIAEAFGSVPASTLAPFQYLEILGATAAGYFVFGDFPDSVTWLGVALILGSGFYVFSRERRAKAKLPHQRRAVR